MLSSGECGLSGYFQSRAGAGSQAIPAIDAPTLAKFRATADVDEVMSADQLGVHVSVRMWKPGQLSEDPLDDVKDVLDPRADTRLGMIDLASATGETSGASCSLLREILSYLNPDSADDFGEKDILP